MKLIFAGISASVAAMAGYVINDLFDIEIDRINRPERALPGNKMSLRGRGSFIHSSSGNSACISDPSRFYRHLDCSGSVTSSLSLFMAAKKSASRGEYINSAFDCYRGCIWRLCCR